MTNESTQDGTAVPSTTTPPSSVTITAETAAGAAIVGASAYVTTGSSGAGIVDGPDVTNSSGQAVFSLDDGTYYLWVTSSTYTFTNPTTLTVSSTTTQTVTGTLSSSRVWTPWTVDTLGADVRGGVSQDAEAGTGTAPNRILTLVREAGIDLWNAAPWGWRKKRATFSTVDGTATVDAPADFGAFEVPALAASDDLAHTLAFTDSTPDFQQEADSWGTAEGQPVAALIERDLATTSSFKYRFRLAPTPDAAYTYTYWYLQHDPWTVGTGYISDNESPLWPQRFHIGWRLAALARVVSGYGDAKQRREAKDEFDAWLGKEREDNAAGLVPQDVYVQDAYQDPSAVGSRLRGTAVRVVNPFPNVSLW